MRWSEFKEIVEKEVGNYDPEINFIDVDYPEAKFLTPHLSPDGELTII